MSPAEGDAVARRAQRRRKAPRSLYVSHWSEDRWRAAVDRGEVAVGVLRVNARRPAEAYVKVGCLERDVYVGGVRRRNRALDGDVVAVQLRGRRAERVAGEDRVAELTEQLAGSRLDATAPDASSSDTESVVQDGMRSRQREVDGRRASERQAHGAVVAIVQRLPNRRICGRLRLQEDEPVDERTRLLVLQTDDPRLPDFYLSRPSQVLRRCRDVMHELRQRLLAAEFVGEWRAHELYPRCRLVCQLGSVGDLAYAELARDDERWRQDIERQVQRGRRDLRQTHRVFSIDPPGARDVDDALSISYDAPRQEYRVAVHIADVSYFVRAGSALDREAAQRGNSFYLVRDAIPMLPPALSEQRCSLLAHQDRLAVSVEFVLHEDATLAQSPWMGRTVIRSSAKLTYADAQRMIEQRADEVSAPLEQDVRRLYRLAAQLRERRFAAGALRIGSPELCFEVDEETRRVQRVSLYEQREANWLIEEFMLLANIAVAERVHRHLPTVALLRRHPHLDATQLERVQQWARDNGLRLQLQTPQALQASLAALQQAHPLAHDVALSMLVRAMPRAEYFCAGEWDDVEQYRHTALHVPLYTHFTSPIRRYADIVVHRQLLAVVTAAAAAAAATGTDTDDVAIAWDGPDVEALAAICRRCNERKQNAEDAEAESAATHLASLLREQPCEYEAVVARFLCEGRMVVVRVPRLDAEFQIDVVRDWMVSSWRWQRKEAPAPNELHLHWDAAHWQRFLEEYVGPAPADHPLVERWKKVGGEAPSAAAEGREDTEPSAKVKVRVRELGVCRVLAYAQAGLRLAPRYILLLPQQAQQAAGD
eukprot:ctg_627.g307